MTAGETLDEVLGDATRLVFLCSGNVVRSAFAELYARSLDCPVPVASAATTFRNPAIFPETVRALRDYGVEGALVAGFRPTHLDELPFDSAGGDVVLGMTGEHVRYFGRLRPELAARAFRLASILGHETDIADPVLEGADFGATYAHVARCVERLLERLRRA